MKTIHGLIISSVLFSFLFSFPATAGSPNPVPKIDFGKIQVQKLCSDYSKDKALYACCLNDKNHKLTLAEQLSCGQRSAKGTILDNIGGLEKKKGKSAESSDAGTSFGEAFVEALLLVRECLEGGGEWNSTRARCECPAGTIEAPRSWDFGSGDSGGTVCATVWCGYAGQVYDEGQDRCVCGPNFGQVSSYDGEPLTYDNGSPKCLPRVESIKLKIWTGDIDDAGTDAGFLFLIGWATTGYTQEAMTFQHIGEYDSGRDTSYASNPYAAVILVGDEGDLTLNRGDVDTIVLPGSDPDVVVHEAGRSIDSLLFCRDIMNLAIYPNPDFFDHADSWTESTIFGDASGFDAWYITRIQMKVKLQGQSSYQTVFDDPAVNQWVEIPNSDYSYRWPINVIRRTIPCDEME